MKKTIAVEEQHVKNGEQKQLHIREHDSPGYGPTVYMDQVCGREVDEVRVLRAAAWELTEYLDGQWDDDQAQPHQLEMTVSALLGVILMWQARVPSTYDREIEQREAEEAKVRS